MTTTALLTVALATAAVAGLDLTVLPLLVTIASRVGLIDPPPSLSWLGSPAAIGSALALYVGGIVSARLGRPGRLKLAERVVGLPFSAVSLAAVGMSAASHAGIDGHLISESGTAADWVDTHKYAGTDVATLGTMGVVAVPFAFLGKVTRIITQHLPFTKGIHTSLAVFGVGASAIIARLPAEARLALAAAALSILLVFALGIAGRIRALIRWWREEAEDAPTRQRLGVLIELVLPGSGSFVVGKPWSGVPRLLLAGLLLMGFLVLGFAVAPVYLFLGLGGALQVSRLGLSSAHGWPGLGGEGAPALATEEVRSDAIGVAASTVSEEDDW